MVSKDFIIRSKTLLRAVVNKKVLEQALIIITHNITLRNANESIIRPICDDGPLNGKYKPNLDRD